jgi:chromosome segregation ATPase
MAEQLLETRG